jgi:hypothetical protein
MSDIPVTTTLSPTTGFLIEDSKGRLLDIAHETPEEATSWAEEHSVTIASLHPINFFGQIELLELEAKGLPPPCLPERTPSLSCCVLKVNGQPWLYGFEGEDHAKGWAEERGISYTGTVETTAVYRLVGHSNWEYCLEP